MAVPVSSYPTRAPVQWHRIDKVEGDYSVVIVIEKQFSRLESFIAKFLRAPVELRRPLDRMNSTLWELMDGKHSFEDIASEMDIRYNEEIAPSGERCAASIEKFVELNLAIIRTSPINGEWDVSPSP
ncbi:MAG: hypothetical protein QGI73_05470 [Candidatus Thalassarchaeaceae archaeon]|nr:hypothetical protein [Euryarchaeota archaeon]MDP6871661.1 hypothetical protein [Candidatus Thalassarchaeaceae archaeon]